MNILEHRLSFIFHETILEPLLGGVPIAELPAPQTMSRALYQASFDQAQRARPEASALSQPWPVGGAQGFWQHYLEEKLPLPAVTGGAAWRESVPWRLAHPIDVRFGCGADRVMSEGFVHPWGVTFVLTVSARGSWSSVADLEQWLFDVRWEPAFEVESVRTRLEAVAAEGLNALRRAAFGSVAAGSRVGEPFSLFTVLQADGEPAELDPRCSMDVRRLLHAATTFSPTAGRDDLPDLHDQVVAGRRNGPGSHVIYGMSRGRAIWGPEHFKRPNVHTLSCQHRNLVHASAQVESLCGLHRTTATKMASGRPLKHNHAAVLKRATEQLRQMYQGQRTTFRSKSVPAQMEMAGWLEDINVVRERLELPALASPAPR